jgi:hypothetical protein
MLKTFLHFVVHALIMISTPLIKQNLVLALLQPLVNFYLVIIFTTSLFLLKMHKRLYRNWKVKGCDYNHFLLIPVKTPLPGMQRMIFLMKPLANKDYPLKLILMCRYGLLIEKN